MLSSAKRRTSSTIRRVPTGEGSSGPLTEGLTSTDRQLGFQKQLSTACIPRSFSSRDMATFHRRSAPFRAALSTF